MPCVSVIIPTFNRETVIGRSIHSVLMQSFPDFELIVVDDGSDDGTETRVAAFRDPRIRYVRHALRRGAAAARNTGIRLARGEWIAFQDSDDEWRPEKLEKQLALARSHSDADLVVYSGLLRWIGSSAVHIPHRGIRRRDGRILDQLVLGNFVSTQTLLAKKTCLLGVGGFDERLGRLQDWDLAIRLAERFPFLLADEPLVEAYHSAGSITDDDEALTHALATILEKHAGAFSRVPHSRFAVLIAFSLYNLSKGKLRLARRHLRESMKFRPQSFAAWWRFLFSWLLPNIFWRLRDRRFGRKAPGVTTVSCAHRTADAQARPGTPAM